MDIEARAAQFGRRYETLRAEVGKVIVGHEAIVEGVLTCLLAGGHGLLEGVPGLGKTLLVRTLAQALDLPFARIQFTLRVEQHFSQRPAAFGTEFLGRFRTVEDVSEFLFGPVCEHAVLQ